MPSSSEWLHFSVHINQFSRLGFGRHDVPPKRRNINPLHCRNPKEDHRLINSHRENMKAFVTTFIATFYTASEAARLVAVRMSVEQQQLPLHRILLCPPSFPPIVLLRMPIKYSFRTQNNVIGSNLFRTSASLSPSDPLVCTGGGVRHVVWKHAIYSFSISFSHFLYLSFFVS